MCTQIQDIIEQIQCKYGVDFVSVTNLDCKPYEASLTWKYAVGNIGERFRRIVLQSGKGIAGIVYKTGKPMYVENTQESFSQDRLFNYPIIGSEQLKSLCALPLYRGSRVEGVVLLGFRKKDKMTPQLYDKILNNMEEDFQYIYHREMVTQ